MARVALENLTVRFGAGKAVVNAVDDLSIAFEQGEFVVLLGPSGCGKTTTLRCIAGLQQPTSGDILFDGQDGHAPAGPLAQGRDGVPVRLALPTSFGARQHRLPAAARGVTRRSLRSPARSTGSREIFDLGGILDRRPGVLPPGARQKAALARAVVREPHVLLLDEPLVGDRRAVPRGDALGARATCRRQLGVTTIHVTHDQREAMSLADRVVLMRDGKIVQVGSPGRLVR